MDSEIPETHVLAIASHVTSGYLAQQNHDRYVGNTMAVFCMQTLGCEVSAIHTVNYSNHVGYRRFTGRKSTPNEVAELYAGLKNARLANFDVLLSGYCPSAALVEQVGVIAREIKEGALSKPGSFFWVLDPVMGDNGRLYVAEETVPVYRSLLKNADLILPNQFEAELLSGVKIHDLATMKRAITELHGTHELPHVLITSIRLPSTAASTPLVDADIFSSSSAKLSIIGSTATSDHKPRLFRITVPALPVFFSGTGDMFASLMVARLRQAAKEAGLLDHASWRSADDVAAVDLPLAKAASKVLASMHAVLQDTAKHVNAAMQADAVPEEADPRAATDDDRETRHHLHITRAAEVRVVRNAQALRHPEEGGEFQAMAVVIDEQETGEDER